MKHIITVDFKSVRQMERKKIETLRNVYNISKTNASLSNDVNYGMITITIIIYVIGQILAGYRLLMMINDNVEFQFLVRESVHQVSKNILI